MGDSLESLPNDVDALKAALVAERGRRIVAETDAAFAKARASDDQALIAHLKLQIEKLNRDRYGPRSERTARLLDQLELTLEELEASATEDELAAEMAAARTANATTTVASFTRKRPSRQPFPDHLPRERVIVPGPTACLCCGGERLRKLGETVTETLESIPRQWKVIQHVELSPNFGDGGCRSGGGGCGLTVGRLGDDLDPVVECHTKNEFWQLVVSIETSPAFLCALKQFEDHCERGSVGQTALRPDRAVAHGGEGAFNRIGGPQVFPVLGREVVERQ
jgi:Transposase C of IS166 homeodomain/zinc-finger binding domain of transposase IS66